ncbi:hypothetical protein J8273_7148 [Carpediemonas membranifera]|uniref:Uncharacterized protein n=1 Tax=Carpediemonas membranifera TaxID=201153 RepID=A0A8J6AQD3_9EUKA|nr:hypothetical protein J8273_7148 [Carpediemonas membranifera]|eukprot:KAG9390883.1 hypothetical protein J8273_7148 [Carpediemonas membranifera]
MISADSSQSCIREALISAFSASLTATASISGDIPSLLQCAYSRHFGEQMPSIHNNKSTSAPASAASLDSLCAMLSEIPPLEPSAQALLDRARSILTSGPPLSMNVELADGEELPVALHTLNQGAVWACLVGGGANPDLEDRVLMKAREEQPDETKMQNKICKALTPEAKCLWFLCRKFFFTMNVAEKDSECQHYTAYNRCYHHRMYMGRLFMLDTRHFDFLTRARMPRALEVFSDKFTHIARTPKGLWGWGDSRYRQLGFESSGFVDPTRLTFPACPKVTALETSLPPWEKHRMVTDVSMDGDQTFILTPASTIMACWNPQCFVGPVEDENMHLFHPVAVPTDFVPDHIMHVGSYRSLTVLSMGDRHVISGHNWHGRLGLRHDNEMTGFSDLPFSFERVIPGNMINVYLSGRQLLFAGFVYPLFVRSGLLPGSKEEAACSTLTPLCFPERVKGCMAMWDHLVWVTEGRTHHCDDEDHYSLPFEATAFGRRAVWDYVHEFRDTTGQWFDVMGVSDGVAELVRCETPFSREVEEIIPVDVDPWPISKRQ